MQMFKELLFLLTTFDRKHSDLLLKITIIILYIISGDFNRTFYSNAYQTSSF